MTHALAKETVGKLRQAARAAAAHAYAPHSNYPVGCALLASSGEIISGCNVENASFGLSMCAERSAVFTARSRLLIHPRTQPISAVAIFSTRGALPWPCGACRQVLREFADEDTPILLEGEEGIRELRLGELLPHPFRLEPAP
jgi:cytidine deaminase